MNTSSQHHLFQGRIMDGHDVLNAADALPSDYPWSQFNSDIPEASRRHECQIIASLCRQIGVSGSVPPGLLALEKQVHEAQLILGENGLEVYRQYHHDRVMSGVNEQTDFFAWNERSIPQEVCHDEYDQMHVLGEMRRHIKEHLEWRRELVLRHPRYQSWWEYIRHVLELADNNYWPIPDCVVYLMAHEARAIVREHTTGQSAVSGPDECIRYSIWSDTLASDLMEKVIAAAIDDIGAQS